MVIKRSHRGFSFDLKGCFGFTTSEPSLLRKNFQRFENPVWAKQVSRNLSMWSDILEQCHEWVQNHRTCKEIIHDPLAKCLIWCWSDFTGRTKNNGALSQRVWRPLHQVYQPRFHAGPSESTNRTFIDNIVRSFQGIRMSMCAKLFTWVMRVKESDRVFC